MRFAACLLVFGLVSGPGGATLSSARSAGVRYQAPVAGPVRVVHPFVAPTTVYGAGHRGVDLASRRGTTVLAAGAGTVAFAGLVAGRGVIVIAHADGVRTEYEPVRASVHPGMTVAGGTVIGVVDGAHGGCAPNGCLHWGARRGDAYFDPLTLLRPLGVVRLQPLD